MAIERRRLTPPPIHEKMIVDGKGTVAFIRYLTDIRESMLKDYTDLTNLQDQIDELQEELDNTQSGAGLGSNGDYIASLVSNYINSASSLFNADILLDAQIKLVQDELDETQSGAGLETNGSYQSQTTSNYIDSATSLYGADELLDLAIFDETREQITTITGSASILTSNQLILCDATAGAINVTLPDPSLSFSNNKSFKIAINKIDISSNIVTILPFNLELVVGEASQFLNAESDILNFITDGTNWHLGA